MLANVSRLHSTYLASFVTLQRYLDILFTSPICRGSRILPSRIAAYLMRRCCFWECFCGLVNDRPTPVRFVTSATGHTRAICHFQVSRCRFSSTSVIFGKFLLVYLLFQSTSTRHVTQRCLNHHMITSRRKVFFHLKSNTCTYVKLTGSY
jgi:hypothetical protein